MITNPFDLIDTRLSNIESILLDFKHSVSLQTPPKQEDSSRLYGDKAVAKHLGCTVQTINQLKKSGKLPFHRVGRRYFYLTNEVNSAFHVITIKNGSKR
jgi:hypothetical protein